MPAHNKRFGCQCECMLVKNFYVNLQSVALIRTYATPQRTPSRRHVMRNFKKTTI